MTVRSTRLCVHATILMISLNSWSCRQKSVSNLNEQKTEKIGAHLVIAHGGFRSCGAIKNENATDKTDQFLPDVFSSTFYYYAVKPCNPEKQQCRKELLWAKKSLVELMGEKYPNKEIKWLVSCYDSGTNVRLVSSDAPNKQIEAASFQKSDPKTKKIDKYNEVFDSSIGELLEGVDSASIIGHSYGGWTAMQTADRLKDKVKILSLTTIDPISMLNCTSWGYLQSAEGCAEFPRDVTPLQRRGLVSKVGIWRNYYQFTTTGGTFSKRLHSGTARTQGVEDRLIGAEHTLIDDNRGVWEKHYRDISEKI